MDNQPNHIAFNPSEFHPMEGAGPEIDMLSGLPLGLRQEEERREKQIRNDTQAQMILQDVQGPGKVILKHLLARCVQRVQELSASDLELNMLLVTISRAVYPVQVSEQFYRESLLLICQELLGVHGSLPPPLEADAALIDRNGHG